jgi:hypothetical protein
MNEVKLDSGHSNEKAIFVYHAVNNLIAILLITLFCVNAIF